MTDREPSFTYEIHDAIADWARSRGGMMLRWQYGEGFTNIRIPDDSPNASRISELKADLLRYFETQDIVLGDHRIIMRPGRVPKKRARPRFNAAGETTMGDAGVVARPPLPPPNAFGA